MTQSIHQIHDKFFKSSLKEKGIVIDFLRAHLPPTVYQLIAIDSLTLTDKSLVLPQLQEIHCDLVYQCKIDKQDGYIVFLFEHLSSAPELMAFRKLQYTVNLMDQYLSEGHTRLPLVLPICLYHGSQSPYPRSTDVYDEFEHPALARELIFKPFWLIDLTTLPDEIIEKHGLAALLETLFKHYRAKNFVAQLKRFARSGLLAATIRQTNQGYLTDVLHYVLYSNRGECPPSANMMLDVLAEALPDEREVMMTFAEELEQRGEQRGWQKGEHQKALSVAKNMLALGLDLTLIRTVTELAEEEITALI